MTALIYTIIVLLLVAADQYTKWLVVTNMELGQTIHAIDGLLDWTYILNDGASFGMMGGKTIFLIVVTCLVMGVLAFFLYSGLIKHITGRIAALLILSGGIGNLIDRIFNDGRVIDFIDIDPIFSFPKFNIADCCVTCGGVLFCIFIAFFYEDKKKKDEETVPVGAAVAAAVAAAGTAAVETVSAAQVTEDIAPAAECAVEQAAPDTISEDNTEASEEPAAEEQPAEDAASEEEATSDMAEAVSDVAETTPDAEGSDEAADEQA